MTEVVVTAGAIGHAKLQSNHYHQQTSTKSFLQAGCPSCRVHTAIPTPVIPTPAIPTPAIPKPKPNPIPNPNPNPIVSIASVGKAGVGIAGVGKADAPPSCRPTNSVKALKGKLN